MRNELYSKLFGGSSTAKISIVSELYGKDTTGHSDGLVSIISPNALAYTDLGEEANLNLEADLKYDLGQTLKLIKLNSYYNVRNRPVSDAVVFGNRSCLFLSPARYSRMTSPTEKSFDLTGPM